MAMASFAYDPEDYAGLGTLGQAIDSFDASPAQTVLDTAMW